MHFRLEISPLISENDTRGKATLNKIIEYFGFSIEKIQTRDVFSIVAEITETDAEKMLKSMTNPVIQDSILGESDKFDFDWIIIIGFLPGVTDNVATTAKSLLCDTISRQLKSNEHIFSSIEYLVSAPQLNSDQIRMVAENLLANPIIQSINCLSKAELKKNGIPFNKPVFLDSCNIHVEDIEIDIPDDNLIRLSKDRCLALSLKEMRQIKQYFTKNDINRQEMGLTENPTDVEIEILAQTWSEHCKHKIFDAEINYTDENGNISKITSLYKSFIKKSTYEIGSDVDWLVSVFSDNAGIISFNEECDLVYKVETHNSPSALDPYGGAMTGIIGVNRDPLGTGLGANLLINVWGYCFGSPFISAEKVPKGLLHPGRIRDGVHQGVIEGGNQSGVPYGCGWELFDDRFIGKPLVFCGTVGLLPKTINGQPGYEKSILPGDLIIMAGGRIGKDGIHGATFSSEALDQNANAQAVQIGDPITQKNLYDFIIEARDRGLYRYITDNGAGGLSSSVGEISTNSRGCIMDIANAPLKYPGLQPWEILLSESQERMTLAVPPEKIAEFKQLANDRDVEISVLGNFTDTGKFHIKYGDKTVAYIDLEFMHEGCPRMQLNAEWTPKNHSEPNPVDNENIDISSLILRLLEQLNICSNETKARQYDHEVKGLSVLKPFVGLENDVQSDASIFMISPLANEGIVLSCGVVPQYSDIDTYHMTASALDLAVRRIIAVGGSLDKIAAIDNFCWPDPVKSDVTPDGDYKLAQLVRSNMALYDYTKAFKTPCISGKDSMKNDAVMDGNKISIPPTLLFSLIGKISDISTAQTLDIKNAGDLVYLIGATSDELGGSEYYRMQGYIGNNVPKVDADLSRITYAALHRAISDELLHSVHTPSIGGLAIGFAKIAIAGRLGLNIDLSQIPTRERLNFETILFSESNSRFIVTLPGDRKSEFETLFTGISFNCVGTVNSKPELTFCNEDTVLCSLAIGDLVSSYKKTLSTI